VKKQQDLLNIVRGAKTIAVIGLSDKPERESYKVAAYLQQKGHRIIPINPYATEVLGEKCYASIGDVPPDLHVNVVNIFRRPDEVLQHLAEIAQRGNFEHIWLAEGVGSQEADEYAHKNHLPLISDKCMMKVDLGQTDAPLVC